MPNCRTDFSFRPPNEDTRWAGDRIAQAQLDAACELTARETGPTVFCPRFQYGLPGGEAPYGEAPEIQSTKPIHSREHAGWSHSQGLGVTFASSTENQSAIRTLYVQASRADLLVRCEKQRLSIQVLQQLESGVLRVVLHSSRDVASLKGIYGSHASQDLSVLQMRA
jgi:hypothetical protein